MALIIGSNNVTINSWDELFNTSWLSLQRVHVSLFDLGSYHVHMLWIRFFLESKRALEEADTRGLTYLAWKAAFTWFSEKLLY